MDAFKVEYTGHRTPTDTETRHIIRYTFVEPKLGIVAGMINSNFIIDSIKVTPVQLFESVMVMKDDED